MRGRFQLETVKRVFYVKDCTGLLVFVNDQQRVDVVCDQLYENGLIAAPLKGGNSKEDRAVLMQKLRAGTLGDKVLVVATEVAARGIDIPGLSHVVNLDLPTDATAYTHRAGRTGRGFSAGTAVTLCEPQKLFVVEKFAKELKIDFESVRVFEGKLELDE